MPILQRAMSRAGSGDVSAHQLSKAFDIQRLRVLRELARQGSVTRAAEALRLAQPTVSLHLKALSAMLGVPVVERRGRRTELTEAGCTLEYHASRALMELERAEEAMERHRGLTAGSLHVGAGTTPGTYVLPGLLGEYHARHPDIALRLEVGSTETTLDLLSRGEIHLGVVGQTTPRADIERRPLLTDRLLCIVSPRHPAVAAGRMTPASLREATLLVREAASSTQAVTDRHLESHGLEFAERWELDSPEAIKQAVRAGLGVAFVSELIVRDELASGDLVVAAIEGVPLAERTLDLVRAADQPLSPPEQAFLELVEERLGRAPPLERRS